MDGCVYLFRWVETPDVMIVVGRGGEQETCGARVALDSEQT
jgi:hypothetical protein